MSHAERLHMRAAIVAEQATTSSSSTDHAPHVAHARRAVAADVCVMATAAAVKDTSSLTLPAHCAEEKICSV